MSVPGVPLKAERTQAGRIACHLVPLLLPTQEQEFGLGPGGSILHPLPWELGEVPALRRVERWHRSPVSAAAPSPGTVTAGAGRFPASLMSSSAYEVLPHKLKMLRPARLSEEIQGRSGVLPIRSQEEQMTHNQTTELQPKIGL